MGLLGIPGLPPPLARKYKDTNKGRKVQTLSAGLSLQRLVERFPNG